MTERTKNNQRTTNTSADVDGWEYAGFAYVLIPALVVLAGVLCLLGIVNWIL